MKRREYFYRAEALEHGTDDLALMLFTNECLITGGYRQALNLLYWETEKHAETLKPHLDVLGRVWLYDGDKDETVGPPDVLRVRGRREDMPVSPPRVSVFDIQAQFRDGLVAHKVSHQTGRQSMDFWIDGDGCLVYRGVPMG